MTIIAVVAAILVMCFRAFVLQNLWSWFIVDTFNVQQLSFKVALGINLIVSLIAFDGVVHTKLNQSVPSSDRQDAIVTSLLAVFTTFFYVTFALIIGWVIHSL